MSEGAFLSGEASFSELLKEETALLEASGTPDAALDAWLLLEFVTGKSRAWYFAHGEEKVPAEQEKYYRELAEKRAEHIPLQHLTHQAFFMGYEFYVDEHVLIPRQDTEILVQAALDVMAGMEKPRILDMCTGSGCILLSLLMERPDAAGLGTDISPEALRVAEKNRVRLEVGERAAFVQSDLFSGKIFQSLSGESSGEFSPGASEDISRTLFSEILQKKGGGEDTGYDILISNPPYIRTSEIDSLMEEVRLHDPRAALDGHEDGLYFYRRITREGFSFLKPGGWLLYEIGYDQGEAVAEILRECGFAQVEVKKDLAGLDRVVMGRKESDIIG